VVRDRLTPNQPRPTRSRTDTAKAPRIRLYTAPLHAASRWVAAAAIVNGVSVKEDPMVYASQWRFVRAVPIVVEPDGDPRPASLLPTHRQELGKRGEVLVPGPSVAVADHVEPPDSA
jgi:hypothetical protein